MIDAMKQERKPPLEGQLYAKIVDWKNSDSFETGAPDTITTSIEGADVITSMIANKVTHHKVIIDLDIPAKLIPSSTEGHFHLYIDHEMTWEDYKKLLDALVDAGLIQEGYRGASAARGYTAVRLPWVRKEDGQDDYLKNTSSVFATEAEPF